MIIIISEYKINFMWDEEACVWIATSEDIRGLVLEHGSFDALVERVKLAVPELLELEGRLTDDICLNYATYRHERLKVSG